MTKCRHCGGEIRKHISLSPIWVHSDSGYRSCYGRMVEFAEPEFQETTAETDCWTTIAGHLARIAASIERLSNAGDRIAIAIEILAATEKERTRKTRHEGEVEMHIQEVMNGLLRRNPSMAQGHELPAKARELVPTLAAQ